MWHFSTGDLLTLRVLYFIFCEYPPSLIISTTKVLFIPLSEVDYMDYIMSFDSFSIVSDPLYWQVLRWLLKDLKTLFRYLGLGPVINCHTIDGVPSLIIKLAKYISCACFEVLPNWGISPPFTVFHWLLQQQKALFHYVWLPTWITQQYSVQFLFWVVHARYIDEFYVGYRGFNTTLIHLT